MSTHNPVSSWTISHELQERFASFSGDRNPMHMDQIAARRTQAGQPVVHGVHTLLLALQSLVAAGLLVSPLTRIKVKFLNWVYLRDAAMLVLPQGEPSNPRMIQVEVHSMRVLTAELIYGAATPSASEDLPASPQQAPRPAPLNRSLDSIDNAAGSAFTASTQAACALFPQLSDYLTGTVVAEIAACSYIVGMEVPGLHSMFSKLDLTLSPPIDAVPVQTDLPYRVSSFDERFRKVVIAVSGQSVRGSLEAFVRVPPVEQATMRVISDRVSQSEFAGIEALIVGGSRGLGELTAKLIAAGGGHPILTYAVGKTDADNVCRDIHEWGGAAQALQYDVRQAPAPQLTSLNSRVSHVFYFATNTIFRQKRDLLSAPILADFVSLYLQGFYDLCEHLLANHPYTTDSKLAAYYPSTVFVEERPAGMTEYSMIKAAGEQMCRDMNQYMPNLRVLVTRLPRLPTDQTANVIPEREKDPIQVMLAVVREMQALSRK